MPNLQNAKKSLRQAKKRALLNLKRKTAFKEAMKNVLKAKNAKEVKELLRLAQKAIDKAAKAKTIKKNTAARKLSRLMKKAKEIK